MQDEYPIPPEVVWSVVTKNFDRAILHPNDLRYELKEPARVQPTEIFRIAYKELIEELRSNLPEDPDDEPVPVYAFSYDWRQPLELIERRLKDFVDEFIARTMLLRHYRESAFADDPKVNLIGHSMGGLIIAGYASQYGTGSRVAKAVSLASPFRSSLEPVLKITTGMADMGTGESKSRERRAARLTPALYHLLPSFEGAIQGDGSVPTDLFELEAWQPNVIETLTSFVKRHGLDPGDPQEQALDLFKHLLGEARSHRQRIESFTLGDAGLDETDWLCVAGIGSKTRVGLEVGHDEQGRVRFVVDSKLRRNEGIETGDGTVPLLGALSRFIPPERVVCISPDDYGYWEIQDKATSKLAGFHGILPNMNMLHRLIVRFFTGRPDEHGNTWGRRPPYLDPGKE